jgi:hypothetical protein
MGSAISEAQLEQCFVLGMWRRETDTGAGRVLVYPRERRDVVTKGPLTMEQWERLENACKPCEPGQARVDEKGKPVPAPTLATALRCLSSLFMSAWEEDQDRRQQQQGGPSGGLAIRGMELGELLASMIHEDGTKGEDWELITKKLLYHHGEFPNLTQLELHTTGLLKSVRVEHVFHFTSASWFYFDTNCIN